MMKVLEMGGDGCILKEISRRIQYYYHQIHHNVPSSGAQKSLNKYDILKFSPLTLSLKTVNFHRTFTKI